MSQKGLMRKRTTNYKDWSWNHELFISKIGSKDPKTNCVSWLGFNGPHASLFGVAKNKKPQMIQARRVLFMAENCEDFEEKAVIMRCGNKHCMNRNHMDLEPNRRLNLTKEQKAEKGFTETRISLERFNDISEDDMAELKQLARDYQADVSFDHEFMFYRITWTSYAWFAAKLKNPHITDLLTVVQRKV